MEATEEFIWMHPPRDLAPQRVPAWEQIMRQRLGWLHADPPADEPRAVDIVEPRPDGDHEDGDETRRPCPETDPEARFADDGCPNDGQQGPAEAAAAATPGKATDAPKKPTKDRSRGKAEASTK